MSNIDAIVTAFFGSLSILLVVSTSVCVGKLLKIFEEIGTENEERRNSLDESFFDDLLTEFRNRPDSLCTTNTFRKVTHVG